VKEWVTKEDPSRYRRIIELKMTDQSLTGTVSITIANSVIADDVLDQGDYTGAKVLIDLYDELVEYLKQGGYEVTPVKQFFGVKGYT
jgi:hypothetical protein